MVSITSVQQLNRELARKINEEVRSNPQSRYRGKFVGIANGQIVVVTDDLDELAKRLREVEPDPNKVFGIEAGRDYDKVEEIWGLR
jgi:pyruvate dehydrogenase complex dehydrogenase (E1) component